MQFGVSTSGSGGKVSTVEVVASLGLHNLGGSLGTLLQRDGGNVLGRSIGLLRGLCYAVKSSNKRRRGVSVKYNMKMSWKVQ